MACSDASSDLDLLAAVTDQEVLDEIAANWESLVDEITPSIYRRLLGDHIVTLVAGVGFNSGPQRYSPGP